MIKRILIIFFNIVSFIDLTVDTFSIYTTAMQKTGYHGGMDGVFGMMVYYFMIWPNIILFFAHLLLVLKFKKNKIASIFMMVLIVLYMIFGGAYIGQSINF